MRWTHPVRGAVPAVSMVTLAEQSGLIVKLGAWVLERSCRDRSSWLEDHPGVPMDIAVNVSARQLMAPDFVAIVAAALARSGMDPGSLILEITENIFIGDSDRAMRVLSEVKNLGVRLALDDFGTGYSSLSYLRRLPIDIVKIDQGFIADLGQDATGSAITSAVTNLAHVLDLTVTAEGVETQAQSDEVKAIGCDSSQGYFFAHPMPAAEISVHLGSLSEATLLEASG